MQSSLSAMEDKFNVEVEKHEKKLKEIELFNKTAFLSWRKTQIELIQSAYDKKTRRERAWVETQTGWRYVVCLWTVMIFSNFPPSI